MRLCFHNWLSNEQSGWFVGKNVQYFLLLESIFCKDQISGPKAKKEWRESEAECHQKESN